MADYIAPKLPNRVIPVTKGTDRLFTIRRRNEQGQPQDWDCEVFIDIDINKASPTRIAATIDQDLAAVRIESTVADQCRAGTTWRVVMAQAGDTDSPTVETALLIGIFERNDGK